MAIPVDELRNILMTLMTLFFILSYVSAYSWFRVSLNFFLYPRPTRRLLWMSAEVWSSFLPNSTRRRHTVRSNYPCGDASDSFRCVFPARHDESHAFTSEFNAVDIPDRIFFYVICNKDSQ